MYGLFPMPWWGYLIELMVVTQFTIFSVTLYLHRCQAHRGLEFHPIVSHFFRFWLWLATGIITKEWVAIHRKHHAKVETYDDPHSPQVSGIKKVFFEGYELYRKESQNAETLARYGEGTPDDWMERHVYTDKNSLGILLMLATNLICFGTVGITIWAIQMLWIPLFAAGVINGLGHYIGYRNFEVKDASRNIVPIGMLLGGEELHNNHHAFATSAKFSAKWWEIDTGWWMIKFLGLFGLAKAKRILPQPKVNAAKTSIDTDTLRALITYRFQVMSRYAREVIAPSLRQERKSACKEAKRLLRSARTVLVRDASIMKTSQKARLAAVLENFQQLRVIYQFRLKLQEVWSRSTANQKELMDALQEWCQQAEATRIEVLQRFSMLLKTYVPQG